MCCERAKTAMEVIKSQGDHDLTRGELLMLFQKMIEDSEKMGNRMKKIKKILTNIFVAPIRNREKRHKIRRYILDFHLIDCCYFCQ